MCVAHGGAGSLSCVCVWPAGRAWRGLGACRYSSACKMPICSLLPAPPPNPRLPVPLPGQVLVLFPTAARSRCRGRAARPRGRQSSSWIPIPQGSLQPHHPWVTVSTACSECPYTHAISQLYPTPSPCITFRVTQASCPGSDTVTCDKAPYQCSWPQQHQCPAPLPAPLQSPWLGWTKLLAQPLLSVGLKVTVMVAGPCAPAGTAEAGGHPTAPPQCVGTPGCSNVLHLWRWGHQHCHSVVLLSPSHSPPALEVSQGTLRSGSSSPG